MKRAQVRAWAERHDLKGSFVDVLAAFEDARTTESPAVARYIDKLRKDKERLDWLEVNGIVEYPLRDFAEGETLRSRIDVSIAIEQRVCRKVTDT